MRVSYSSSLKLFLDYKPALCACVVENLHDIISKVSS